MAIGVHIARVAFLSINKITGLPIDKNSPDTKIKDVLRTEQKHVVMPDTTNAPNSSGYPTVAEYLKLEAAGNYVVGHLDQNTIVTYNVGDLNAA